MREYRDSVSSATTGIPVYLAQVRVLNSVGAPASLFSDNGITPLTQPVLTDGLGMYTFFVADGTYTLVIAGPTGLNPVTLLNVEIYEDARNVSVPVGEPAMVLPSAGSRAGKLVKWGALGDGAKLDAIDIDAEQLAADADQAALDAATASAAAATAVAAVQANGANVRIYSTYAAVSAAATGNALNGIYVEIQDDEQALFKRTRRLVTGNTIGAVLIELPKLINGSVPYYMAGTQTRFADLVDPLDGVTKAFIVPHLYLDEVNGIDTNNGRYGNEYGSGNGPIKTVAKLLTMPQCANGLNIALKDNNIWSSLGLDFAEPNAGNGNKQLSNLTIVPYGNGIKLMKIKGTEAALAASFTASVSNVGAYEINWTHDMYQVSGNAALMVVQKMATGETQPLVRKQNKNQVTAQGQYWYDSSLSDVGTEAMCIWAWGNLNLTTSANGTIEITKRRYAMSGRDDCYFSGFYCKAHGGNNGSFFTYARPVVARMLCELGGKHNYVAGAGLITDVIAVNCQPSTSYWPEGGNILGTIFEGDMTGKTCAMTRCGFFCDDTAYVNADSGKTIGQPWYAHSAVGGLGGTFRMVDCWNANTGNSGGNVIFSAFEMIRHYSTGFNNSNTGTILGNSAGTSLIQDSVILNCRREAAYSCTLSRSIFLANGTLSGALLLGGSAAYNINNCIFHDIAGSSSPWLSLSIPSLSASIVNNVFSNSLYAVDFGSVVTTPTALTMDWNYYDLQPDPAGSTFPYPIKYQNLTYTDPALATPDGDRTFAQWQALGYDTNSTQATTPSIDWLGASPTLAHPEYAVLDPASPMYGHINSLTATEILAVVNKPLTLSAALAYLETTATTYYPVYVA